jgi:hypothetical protein
MASSKNTGLGKENRQKRKKTNLDFVKAFKRSGQPARLRPANDEGRKLEATCFGTAHSTFASDSYRIQSRIVLHSLGFTFAFATHICTQFTFAFATHICTHFAFAFATHICTHFAFVLAFTSDSHSHYKITRTYARKLISALEIIISFRVWKRCHLVVSLQKGVPG